MGEGGGKEWRREVARQHKKEKNKKFPHVMIM